MLFKTASGGLCVGSMCHFELSSKETVGHDRLNVCRNETVSSFTLACALEECFYYNTLISGWFATAAVC